MSRAGQWFVMAAVVIGHLLIALWLSYAMALPTMEPAEETVMYVEWVDSPVLAKPNVGDSTSVVNDPAPSAPTVRPGSPVVPPSSPSATMEAVIQTPSTRLPPADPPRQFVSPDRDPFHRPSVPGSERFRRRDRLLLPDSDRPRIAGERPPDAVLPELRMRDRSPQRIAEVIGSFIGGGRNAPVEAPCGGRINGGALTADSFSPAWQAQHGCGDMKERAGYDGTVELPPGIAR